MRAALAIGIACAALAASAGCLRQATFRCEADTDCGSGTCEAVGYCSFDDTGCPDGRRYGELSGPIAGQCVTSEVDAGVDAPIDAPLDAPMCPTDYVVMGTSSYRLVTTLTGWAAAQADCADDGFGTHLAVAADVGEIALVDTISTASRTWLGITDVKVPATWRWVTGAVGPIVPDSITPGDCGYYFDATGGGTALVQNRTCTSLYAYLCECDLVPSDPTAF